MEPELGPTETYIPPEIARALMYVEGEFAHFHPDVIPCILKFLPGFEYIQAGDSEMFERQDELVEVLVGEEMDWGEMTPDRIYETRVIRGDDDLRDKLLEALVDCAKRRNVLKKIPQAARTMEKTLAVSRGVEAVTKKKPLPEDVKRNIVQMVKYVPPGGRKKTLKKKQKKRTRKSTRKTK
jgi:hypothetical protein